MGNAHPSIVPYETFAADRPLAVAVGNDAQFERLCSVIGREDLSKDGRFATNPGRVEHRRDLVAELECTFSGRTADEWAAEIRAAGVPCGPVNSLADVFSDPHVLSSGMLRNVEHPAAGTLGMLASPLLINGRRPPIRCPRPRSASTPARSDRVAGSPESSRTSGTTGPMLRGGLPKTLRIPSTLRKFSLLPLTLT
jgi:crotonobetainyl-CoA:carnitine CoA-transferase CaiB-like acyl-CoA transferase